MLNSLSLDDISNYKYSPLIIFILILTGGCENYYQQDYHDYVVLESYVVANRALPEVWLSRTLPSDKEYNFPRVGLGDADVKISLLDEEGNKEKTFDYDPASGSIGKYIAENQSHRVLPRRTYQIDVQFENRPEVLHAETTIPDTVTYQSANQMELVLSPIEETRDQSVFIFNTIAENPSKENLTPFYKDQIDNDDIDIEDFYNNYMGPINEGNFDINADGTITITYPWFVVAFFGKNYVITNSLDTNLSDLVSSQNAQLGGGTLSPGEIPNLNYNVEGGIGVFGSFASDTVQTFFKRPEGM